MGSFKTSAQRLLACLVATQIAAQTHSPRVDLGYVQYQGVHNETLGINTFYGIRYAVAPTGPLRWRAPVGIERHNNYTHGKVLDASKPGPQCMQGSLETEMALAEAMSSVPGVALALGVGSPEGLSRSNSEDCLLLDIIVPAKPKSGSLPVVILIHGGGFVTGNTQTVDGSPFVSSSNGSVVWVAIQYRLGAYGFLGAQEVLADGDANIGLLDQRAAFQWVQKHIAAFGGDPDKVTIWGTSAGGSSVVNQLTIDASVPNPPYRAAIAEFPWFQPYHDSTVLEAQYHDLLTASGCSNLACLRALSEDALLAAANATFALGQSRGLKGQGDFYYGPYVDGTVIRDLPSNEFARGRFHKVPLLIDHDSQEGLLFQNFAIATEDAVTAELSQLWPTANRSCFFPKLYALYPLSAFTGSTFFSQPFFRSAFFSVLSALVPSLPAAAADAPLWQAAAIFGDAVVACPTRAVAAAASAARQPVWKLLCQTGVYVHAASSVFVLGDAAVSGNATLARIMRTWYLSFVVDLDPNAAGGAPRWPQYGLGNGTVMVVTDDGVGAQADGDASARCEYLRSRNHVVRN